MTLLEIKSLTKFFGGLRAVNNFSLKLEKGEVIGLIGPNGAGKTTVFNLVTGVYQPTEGKIIFKGIELNGKKPYEITSLGTARTFQNIRLFSKLSAINNIKVAYHFRTQYSNFDAMVHNEKFLKEEKEIDEMAYELLKIFNMASLADEIAGSLPYGQQRRLEIARALATKPSLLLLDEPAAGMNPYEADKLMETIKWLREKFDVTIFLIEHQMRVVMGVCERIKVMDFGETISEGPPSYIQNDPKVIEAYLGKEAKYVP